MTTEEVTKVTKQSALEQVADTHSVLHDQGTLAYRWEQFTKLGFNPEQALALADTRAWPPTVADLLKDGCSHEQAVAIMT